MPPMYSISQTSWTYMPNSRQGPLTFLAGQLTAVPVISTSSRTETYCCIVKSQREYPPQGAPDVLGSVVWYVVVM